MDGEGEGWNGMEEMKLLAESYLEGNLSVRDQEEGTLVFL